MECNSGWFFSALMIGIVALYGLLSRANEWIYLKRCSSAMHDDYKLPPGNLGWPFIGSMFSFFRAFKYGHPDSFISSLTSRFGKAPMYRAFLFGNPSIIVTTAEACRKVLTDEERFGPGWPKSVSDLVGKRGLHGVSNQEHRRLRKLIASPVAGQEALAAFIEYIKEIAATSFETWAKINQPIEFLTEMKKIAFKAIMNIIMSNEIDVKSLDYMEREYNFLSHGLKSMPINLPGFAYHKALKARKNMVKAFGRIVRKRRMMSKGDELITTKKDMLALMMEISDGHGNKLTDEEIVDLLIIFLLAGHESTGHIVTWAIILLEENPQFLQTAKEEQEEIVKRRASSETGLNLSEIKQMKYLKMVIDESLRFANISFALFREARVDVNIDGYTIPKGWKVLPWIRNVHINDENYERPYDFNPSRWEDHKGKVGTFVPFGAGGRLCPGADLAKIEVSVFLHYFLLNYRLDRVNPRSKIKYLPITRPGDNCLARIRKVSSCA